MKYTKQQEKIKTIVGKYWHMLLLDPSLRQFVPETPLFTFKRATSVKDRLINSEFKGDAHNSHCKYKGNYICGACNSCKYMYTPDPLPHPTMV